MVTTLVVTRYGMPVTCPVVLNRVNRPLGSVCPTGESPPYAYWFRLVGSELDPNNESREVKAPIFGLYRRLAVWVNPVDGSVGWPWNPRSDAVLDQPPTYLLTVLRDEKKDAKNGPTRERQDQELVLTGHKSDNDRQCEGQWRYPGARMSLGLFLRSPLHRNPSDAGARQKSHAPQAHTRPTKGSSLRPQGNQRTTYHQDPYQRKGHSRDPSPIPEAHRWPLIAGCMAGASALSRVEDATLRGAGGQTRQGHPPQGQ